MWQLGRVRSRATTAPSDEISVDAETVQDCGTGQPLSRVLIRGNPKRPRVDDAGFPLAAFAKRVTMPSTLIDLGGVRALMTAGTSIHSSQRVFKPPRVAFARLFRASHRPHLHGVPVHDIDSSGFKPSRKVVVVCTKCLTA